MSADARAGLAATLRGALLAPRVAERIPVAGATQAAVLVPLYVDAAGAAHAVFTERRPDLRRHAGEISFPGGRRDPDDADLRATALRETHEELGLPPHAVELLGALAPAPTVVSGYAVYPYVGLIEPGFPWVAAEAEVGRVLELPLTALRDGYARRRLAGRGMPWRTDTFEVDGHLIWGVTARIVFDLLARIERPLRR